MRAYAASGVEEVSIDSYVLVIGKSPSLRGFGCCLLQSIKHSFTDYKMWIRILTLKTSIDEHEYSCAAAQVLRLCNTKVRKYRTLNKMNFHNNLR